MARRPSIFLGAIVALGGLTAFLQAAPPQPTNVVFSQVGTSTLSVDWQGVTNSTTQFVVELSSGSGGVTLSSATFLLTSTFTVLDVNTQYFAVVQASDTVDG